MIVINGGTFNFTEDGYTPPSASGTIYNFEYTGFTLNQIWKDDDYVYVVHNVGLEVIEIDSEEKIAYIEPSFGFNSVWASDSMVFLGTTFSGIKYIEKTCISGTVLTPENLITCLTDYTPPYGITSQNIRYIHGNSDYIMWCTDLGVDVYRAEPYGYRSFTTVSGAQKCFMTSIGRFYYTTVSGATVSGIDYLWSLNRLNNSLTDWTVPDYSYSTGINILPVGLEINDIFVTESTAANGIDNTVFIATSSGVFVIDEGNLNYNVYLTSTISGGILTGTSNNFTAIWADADAGLSNGKFYVASPAAFSIVDNTVLCDYYTADHAGAANETLEQNDIVDINI